MGLATGARRGGRCWPERTGVDGHWFWRRGRRLRGVVHDGVGARMAIRKLLHGNEVVVGRCDREGLRLAVGVIGSWGRVFVEPQTVARRGAELRVVAAQLRWWRTAGGPLRELETCARSLLALVARQSKGTTLNKRR